MKIAYFDCFAGAGGDMITAAMLDAGLDAQFLKTQLATLNIENLDIKIAQTQRCGTRAVTFAPTAPDQKSQRNLRQIIELINSSKISKKAKQTAVKIFEKLARAEATVHGTEPGNIHFHEVGAVDSIVDIVSACIGLEALSVDRVYSSALSVGGGTIESAHGLMPCPAPATAELLKGLPILGGPGNVELLTPTAAAILTTIVDEFVPLPPMRIEAIGYGAGSIQSEKFPNVLRLILGRSTCQESENTDSICLIEANTDDATGELIGFVMDNLFGHGALDVFTTPIYMKHNRPAVKISVICKISDIQQLERILLEQGITFGIRKQMLQRTKLTRDFVSVETEYGSIRIKVGCMHGRVVNAKPEFSDCAAAAKTHKVAVKTIAEAAMRVFGNQQAKNQL